MGGVEGDIHSHESLVDFELLKSARRNGLFEHALHN